MKPFLKTASAVLWIFLATIPFHQVPDVSAATVYATVTNNQTWNPWFTATATFSNWWRISSNVSRHTTKWQTWSYRLYDPNGNLYDEFTSYPFVNAAYSQWQYQYFRSAMLDDSTGVITVRGEHWSGWGWSSTYDVGKFKISKKYVDAAVVSPVTFGDPLNFHAILSLYESGAVSPTMPVSKLTRNHGGSHTDSQSYYGWAYTAWTHGCTIRSIDDTPSEYGLNYRCSFGVNSYYYTSGNTYQSMSDYDGTFALDKTKYSLCRYDSAYCSPAEMQAYWIFDDMEWRGNMRSVPSSGTVASFDDPESVKDRTVAMLSLYPSEASWFAHYGLPLASFNGGSATFRVDWNGGTNAPKSDFSSGGRFYGWKWSSKETGGSNLSDAAFDFGNPLPSVRWKWGLENGSFTPSGYDWNVWGAWMALYPIKTSTGSVVAYPQYPSGNLLCETAGCRSMNPLPSVDLDFEWISRDPSWPPRAYFTNTFSGTSVRTDFPGNETPETSDDVSDISNLTANPDGSVLAVWKTNGGEYRIGLARTRYSSMELTSMWEKFQTPYGLTSGNLYFNANQRYPDGTVVGIWNDWNHNDGSGVAGFIVRRNGTVLPAFTKFNAGFAGITGEWFQITGISRDAKRVMASWSLPPDEANPSWRNFAWVWNPEDGSLVAQFETYSYDPATGSSENFEPFFGPEFHELYGIRSRTPPSGWSDTETSYEKYDPATGTWEEVWKFRQNEYQSVWLPNWKRAVFKRNSDGAVFVRNLDTGVQTRSPFDNALQTWPNVSFGTNVIAGKFVTFGEIGGGRWAVWIDLDDATQSKLAYASTVPSTFDSDSVQPLRFKAREKVKATGVTKIYQKSDPTAGRVSRTDDNVLRVGPFKFFPFTEPFRLR